MTVNVPKNFAISFSKNDIEKQSVDSSGNNNVYKWEAKYTNPFEEEDFAPALQKIFPWVKIVPLKFEYEIEGSFESWESFGKWQNDILQGLDILPQGELERLNSLIAGINDTKEKIKLLYHKLQDETRYINVTIETGGLKPYSASYVAANKYGDCKALSNYFKAVLNSIGIKSFYTTIYAGSPNLEVNRKFPSHQSNHIILFVPLEKDTLWLDCTSDGPFNYLGTFTQNRDAFIIDKEKSFFMHTPALSEKDVLESRSISIKNENWNQEITVSGIFKGELFEKISELEKAFNKTDKAYILRNFYIDKDLELGEFKVEKSNRDSTYLQLSFNALSHNIYKKYGNDIFVSNIPFSLPEFKKPETRKLPVQIDYPVYKSDTVLYDMIPGYILGNVANASYKSKYGSYSMQIEKYEIKIRIIKTLLLYPGYYEISEYKDFYNFFKKIDESENKTNIVLTKKTI